MGAFLEVAFDLLFDFIRLIVDCKSAKKSPAGAISLGLLSLMFAIPAWFIGDSIGMVLGIGAIILGLMATVRAVVYFAHR